MNDATPALDQVNLVVRDIDATVAFYRRLGLTVPDSGGDWPEGSGARHVEVDTGTGVSLEFDNLTSASVWHGGVRAAAAGGADVARPVIGFALPTREAVDAVYAELTAAGAPGRQPPYDAFWGARYAIVADPDGNDVGLMSPKDPARRFTPPA
jgi:catechol 2,3-dioxygenase-like lactoylglutathione lyase family enzyme